MNLINYYYYKKNNFFGYFFDIYYGEDDEEIVGIYDSLTDEEFFFFTHGFEFPGYNVYFNIIRYENFYLNYFLNSNFKVFKWYSLGEEMDLSNFYFGSSKKYFFELFSKVDQVYWYKEINNFIYYYEWRRIPYDLLKVTYKYAEIYLFNVYYEDIGADSFLLLEEKKLKALSQDKRYPFRMVLDDIEEQLFLTSSNFRKKRFFKEFKDLDLIKLAFQNHKKFIKMYFKNSSFLDRNVFYNGEFNSKIEKYNNFFLTGLETEQTDRTNLLKQLNLYIYKELFSEGILDFNNIIAPKNNVAKLDFFNLKRFSFSNLVINLYLPSFLQTIIPKNFWYYEFIKYDLYEYDLLEDIYLFLENKIFTNKLINYIKKFSFIMGFFKPNEKYLTFTLNSFFNFNLKNYIKYPIYDSFVGFDTIPYEKRIESFLNGKSRGHDLNFYSNELNNSFFISIGRLPLGLSFSNEYFSDTLYKNYNTSLNFEKKFELIDETDIISRKNYFFDLREIFYMSFTITFNILLMIMLIEFIYDFFKKYII